MLVSEIRKELRKYNHKELENIILELYKTIPKKKKEIIYFLDCVDNGYYSSPNRIISKKERSSYRFKIKK